MISTLRNRAWTRPASGRWEHTVASAFDPRANVLNALRLVLASMVIVRHAALVLDGTVVDSLALDQLFGQLPVDGFFVLSGFLVSRAWLNRPDVGFFLRARVARILPGYWGCLLVTGVVVAPLASAIAGVRPWDRIGALGWLEYFARNLGLVVTSPSIHGTPVGVPFAGDWNASLWTLKWEFGCYLVVLALGVAGLLTRRWLLVGLALSAWAAEILVREAQLGVGDVAFQAIRFALMYALGVALWQLRDAVPVTAWSGPLALLVAVLCAVEVSSYRAVVAPVLAYGLVATGVWWRWRPLRLPNDISYGMYVYGFPVEQLLAHSGALRQLGRWEFSALAILVTVPFAAISWFGVERPVHRLVGRRRAPARRWPRAEAV